MSLSFGRAITNYNNRLTSVLIPRSKFDPQTVIDSGRISAVSGYGYYFSASEKILLDSRLKLFRANGGIPDWYLHPSLSVNKNLLQSSQPLIAGGFLNNGATLGTPDSDGWCLLTDGNVSSSGYSQTLNILPLIPYNISFEVKSGTSSAFRAFIEENVAFVKFVDSGNVTGVPAGGQRYSYTGTNASNNSSRFNISVGTLAGINEGNIFIRNLQVEAGGVVTNYTLRSDNTVVRALNLGAKNAQGDCTYVNGTSRNMQGFDSTSGRTIRTVSASSQSLLSSITDYYPSFSFLMWIKPTSLPAGVGRLLRKGTASDRLSINSSGALQFNGVGSEVIISANSVVTTGAWQLLAFSISNVTASLYKNGALLSPVANTIAGRDNESIQPYSISGPDSFVNGDIGETMLIPANLTPAQHLAIYNATKSTYGL
jgi:hypothetical protein